MVTTENRALRNPLSSREQEVLNLLRNGATNKEIAATLCISPNTAKTHVVRIMAKLDVQNRTAAVAMAGRNQSDPPRGIASPQAPALAPKPAVVYLPLEITGHPWDNHALARHLRQIADAIDKTAEAKR